MSGTIIKTKFSLVNAQPISDALAQGEQAYSYISNKLWIGWENAGSIEAIAIGGKFYTDQLKHALDHSDKGILEANKAIVVDSNSKIDRINIDNVTIDGNTITTTDTNGDLIITPDGSGKLNINANTNISGTLSVSGAVTYSTSLVVPTMKVSDLSDNRVVIVGPAGEIEDSGNFTFDGTNLTVTGNQTTTGNSTVNGHLDVDTSATIATLKVEDLTQHRITFAGSGGELADNTNLTYNGTTLILIGDLDVTGTVTISDHLDVNTSAAIATLKVEDLTAQRIVLAGAGGEIEDSGNFTFDGSLLTINGDQTTTGNAIVNGTVHVDGQTTLASVNVEDLSNDRIVFVGPTGELVDSADLTFNDTVLTLNANQQVTGTLNVDSQTTLASLNVEDLINNRVLVAGVGGEVEDDGNFTWDGTLLTLVGASKVDNIQTSGNLIEAVNTDGSITLQPKENGVVTINSDTFLTIPLGDNATRPGPSVDGSMRYNTETGRFEGVQEGAWQMLGGVVDINQDTYVSVEIGDQAGFSSLNDDTIRFVASNHQALTITNAGLTVTDQITTPIANITTANTTTANIGTINVTTQMQVDADANFSAGIDVTSGNVDIQDNLNVQGHAVVEGNLTVRGTTTSVESTVTTLNDPVIKVGANSLVAIDLIDRGVNFDYGDGAAVKTGFFGFDNATQRFSFKPDVLITDEDYDAPWGDAQFANLFLRGELETGATGNLVIADNMVTTKTGDLHLHPAGITHVASDVEITSNLLVQGNVTFDLDVPVTSGGTGMSSFVPNSIMVSSGAGDALEFIDIAGIANPEDYIIKFNSAGVPVASNVIDGGTF